MFCLKAKTRTYIVGCIDVVLQALAIFCLFAASNCIFFNLHDEVDRLVAFLYYGFALVVHFSMLMAACKLIQSTLTEGQSHKMVMKNMMIWLFAQALFMILSSVYLIICVVYDYWWKKTSDQDLHHFFLLAGISIRVIFFAMVKGYSEELIQIAAATLVPPPTSVKISDEKEKGKKVETLVLVKEEAEKKSQG